jgi:hypothetical protein
MEQAEPLCGVFALDWSQVELDGAAGLGPQWLRIGAGWRWSGKVTRLDGSPSVLPLGHLDTQPNLRTRARNMAARLSGHELPLPRELAGTEAPAMGLVLTDGARVFAGRLVQVWGRWTIVFSPTLPPQARDLFVVAFDPALQSAPRSGPAQDVICFAADTLITTPKGLRAVDDIRAGDLVQTLDNGAQRVLWVGQTRISGIALRRFPHLRPVRISAGALDKGIPTDDLRLSPGHRVLVRGRQAQALFNAPEVLVCARDLMDERNVRPDLALHGVTYVHLLLERHQILIANGVPCESFHPDLATPEILRPHLPALRQALPNIVDGRLSAYGETVRRCLNRGEAALLAA